VLLEELGRVRSQGYAINDGESEDGLAAVSAPVVDTRGTAHGAISVSGPRDRILSNRERCVEAVRTAAHDLENAIFGRPSA
jgi:DNA-binding IclR family transcriptional regulator